MSAPDNNEKIGAAGRAPVHARAEGQVVRIERAAVGMVQAERVELRSSGAGVVVASQDVEIHGGGARDIIAGGAVRVTGGGAGALLSGGPTAIENGLVVFALTPKIELGEGGRVLVGTRAALALIAFAVIGAVLVRRR